MVIGINNMTCKHIKAVFPRLMFPNKSGNDVSFIHDFGSLSYVKTYVLKQNPL